MTQTFDPSILTPADLALARRYAGRKLLRPDLVIGKPEYLYRWYVTPRSEEANVYFHIQVMDDPERPLHDHPWDNQSVILSGGYDEIWAKRRYDYDPKVMFLEPSQTRNVRVGDVVHRKAEEAHRLLLPLKTPYTMTLFSTGPHRRDWGFWTSKGWRKHADVTDIVDGQAIWKGPA